MKQYTEFTVAISDRDSWVTGDPHCMLQILAWYPDVVTVRMSIYLGSALVFTSTLDAAQIRETGAEYMKGQM